MTETVGYLSGCVAGSACHGAEIVFYNETSVFSGVLPNDSTSRLAEVGSDSAHVVENRPGAEQCVLFRFVLYGIVCFVLCLVGFVGNVISFIVFRRDKSSPAASFILQALAVADNAFLFLWLGHYPVHSTGSLDQLPGSIKTVLLYLRVYTFPLLYMAQTQTIWLTVAVALNRFTAVCLPYRAHSLSTGTHTHKEVVAVIAFSVVYNAPRFFERYVTGGKWETTRMQSNATYQFVYHNVLYQIVTFFVPLALLAYMNARIVIAFRRTQRRRRRMTTRRLANENNITLVMVIVIVVFMVCLAPARVTQMATSWQLQHCKTVRFVLFHVSNCLEVLNSSVNFVIYFVCRKRFRDILCGNLPCTQRHCRGSLRVPTTTERLSFVEIGHSLSPGRPGSNDLPRLKRDMNSDSILEPRAAIVTDKTTLESDH